MDRMEPSLRVFLWSLTGAAFFGLVGAVFGAIANTLARIHGRAAGGFPGRAVLEAFLRVRRKPFSPALTGVLVGAWDGGAFLAMGGALLGAIAAYRGDVAPEAAAYFCCACAL